MYSFGLIFQKLILRRTVSVFVIFHLTLSYKFVANLNISKIVHFINIIHEIPYIRHLQNLFFSRKCINKKEMTFV